MIFLPVIVAALPVSITAPVFTVIVSLAAKIISGVLTAFVALFSTLTVCATVSIIFTPLITLLLAPISRLSALRLLIPLAVNCKLSSSAPMVSTTRILLALILTCKPSPIIFPAASSALFAFTSPFKLSVLAALKLKRPTSIGNGTFWSSVLIGLLKNCVRFVN